MGSRRNAGLRYETFKGEARRLAAEVAQSNREGYLSQSIDPDRIRWEQINQDAINAYQLCGSNEEFPWDQVAAEARRDNKAFGISLWYDAELCGLCYATPRKSSISLKIVLLEGKPDTSHPLKGHVASLMLTAIDGYARMLQVSNIEVEDPAAGAVSLYQALGFAFDSDGKLVIGV